MFYKMCKSKIHRATVTEADLNYEGSITIDSSLMEAAGILPNEIVQLVDINNGARLETYVMAGAKGSGMVCVNGAAARLIHKNDIIIIISYGYYNEEEVKKSKSITVYVDNKNKKINPCTKLSERN